MALSAKPNAVEVVELLGYFQSYNVGQDEEKEDDDDLFEINLEVVDNIPPPFYWESCFTSTRSTLLANCLLPITDVARAVPITMAPNNDLLHWSIGSKDDLKSSSLLGATTWNAIYSNIKQVN
ncbi:hypothetical protein F511_36674 [Dorcoceras hygrometricum]|uniref:Uncharacterized protein n=1 Tax=Dorcoceras hygrometricum TaxID=472368 RepID=A0A2Z7B2D8_9LAMI|nr:hypothetical protein F511_36674 [Dorcoceras hygrometricum]